MPLTPEERSTRARAAAAVRWSRRSDPPLASDADPMSIDEFVSGALDWEQVPITDATSMLEGIRAELTRASEIINRRIELQASKDPVHCGNPDCGKVIDVERGRYKGRKDKWNLGTQQFESKFACSEACWIIMGRVPSVPEPPKTPAPAPSAAAPTAPAAPTASVEPALEAK